jgi:hypothetical protein
MTYELEILKINKILDEMEVTKMFEKLKKLQSIKPMV